MSLAETLSDDLKKALKSGQKDVLWVIRMIKAAVKNKEIAKGSPLSDEEIHGVLMSLARQTKESIEQFSRGGRQDLAEKETRELAVVQSYLPKQLTEEEINKIIEDTIKETGANGPGDMGKVMKFIMAKIKGRADGKLASELVRKAMTVNS
jgi:uncharacterized protein YqeY